MSAPRGASRARAAKKSTKVDPPKDETKSELKPQPPAAGEVDQRPADEVEPGGPERTAEQAQRSAAAEAPRSSRRVRRQAAVSEATEDNPVRTGKVSVDQAAAILRIYPEEVHSVDKTDQGIVATTTDGQHYLLLEDGFVWLEQPETLVGR